jgi:hypothetical protein
MFVQTAGEMRTAAFGQIRTLAGLDIRGGKLTGNGTVFVSLDSTTPFVQVASGGAVAPGESIGTLTIDGKLILGDGGRLEIELDGATSDVLQVIQSNPLQVPAGDLDLSSANDFLDVKLLGAPMAGPYTIATYSGTLTGIFNHVTPGFSVTYDTAQKRLLLNALVRADFDADGDVDGRDFLIWQRGVGTTTGATRLTGDANFDGAVNAADLAVWRSQFGTSATLAGAPVPEPHSAVLILLGILPAARRGARAHGRASRARRRG